MNEHIAVIHYLKVKKMVLKKMESDFLFGQTVIGQGGCFLN